MPRTFRSLWVLTCGALLASSCAQPIASNQSPPSVSLPQAQPEVPKTLSLSHRRIQSVVECPDGGAVISKPNAPLQTFTSVDKLPTGTALHLDFMARGPKQNGHVPSADKIYFQNDVPFEIQFKEGPAFAVTNADGSDGLVVVELPKGVYDSYVSTKGEPGGSLGISDPLYFLKETWASGTGKESWAHVGVRQLPFPTTFGLGDYRLRFEPRNLTSFSTRWFQVTGAAATQPPLPPMPPAIASLTGPDTVGPGETATLQAAVTDANGDPLTFRWSTTLPTGEVVSGNPVGDATAIWTAPRPSGTYQVSLTVEDPYYSTTVCRPLALTVPNVCPVPTIAGAPTTELSPGATVSLQATGTDANGDALTWRWEAKDGSLSTTTGTTTTWTAPKKAGSYKVTAYADDGHGCEAPAEQTFTVTAPQPTPAPTVAPTPTPSSYAPGTNLKRGLYASGLSTFIYQGYDLSGLQSIPSWKALKIGYFVPLITYDYVYEKDNNNQTIGFSWNYKTYGKYSSLPKATYAISGLSIQNGTLSTDTRFVGLGEAGITSVLLDADNVPLSETRYAFTPVAFNAGRLVNGVHLTRAVPKAMSPTRKYKCYFDDGSIGETDTYNGGIVTGTITAVSPKGSVVMPIGARFKCGVDINSNVYADQPFTPIKPTAIKMYFN